MWMVMIMWLAPPKVRHLGNNVHHCWLCERHASMLQTQSPPRLVLCSPVPCLLRTSCACWVQQHGPRCCGGVFREFMFDFLLLEKHKMQHYLEEVVSTASLCPTIANSWIAVTSAYKACLACQPASPGPSTNTKTSPVLWATSPNR